MTDEPMSDEAIARARRQAEAAFYGHHDAANGIAESVDALIAEVARLRRLVGEPMPTEEP